MAKVKLWDATKWVVTDAANADTLGHHPPEYFATEEDLQAHINDYTNPHQITPGQIGAETPEGAQRRVDLHAELTKAHGSTRSPNANRIIRRDGNARARIQSPADNLDIANKIYVDNSLVEAKAYATDKDNVNRTWTTSQINAAIGSAMEDADQSGDIDGVRTRSTRLKMHTTTSDAGHYVGDIWLRTDL